MKILFCGINYSPELTGIGKYSGEMAPRLVANTSHQVKFITAPPYYPEWKVAEGYSSFLYKRERIQGVDVIRCPLYVPKQVTLLKRLIHLASFALSSFFAMLGQLNWRPDIIVVVVPTFFCTPFALLFAKLVGAKSMIHIQDYELDAMFGLGMAGSGGRIEGFIYRVESWLMRRFDAVSTISYSMMEKAKQKGVSAEKVLFLPNWADTTFVTPDVNGSAIRADWGFTDTDKVVLYAGNMGTKQGLEIVLEAASQYRNRPEVKFVLVGAGAHADVLKGRAIELQLSNVIFKPLQPWENVPAMLAMADVHLVVQKRGAADAVLPSKLTNILSSGGYALVTAEKHTELGKIAEKYPGIFARVEPERIESFIAGLNQCLNMDTKASNSIARQYALQNLEISSILDNFLVDLNRIVNVY